MSARRGASGLSGILLVDKPAGMTSHDVVNRVRRAANEKRVGHAGTLDPMATGLLVVLVGPATRLGPYLTAAEKSYEATITFGAETDTDDAEGQVTRGAHVPEEIFDPDSAAGLLAGFLGESSQVPPAYSAIKRGGVVAHRAARNGSALELEPRSINVSDARLIAIDRYARQWRIELAVSKGTYVRALARDIGRAAGSAAHLGALRRSRSGALRLADAHSLAEIEAAGTEGRIESLFADPVAAMRAPVAAVDEAAAARVGTGQSLDPGELQPGDELPEGPVALVREGSLLAVYSLEDGRLRPQTVFPGGVSRGEYS